MNFGPQTGKNRTGVFEHPPQILHSASFSGVAHGGQQTETNKLCQTEAGKRR